MQDIITVGSALIDTFLSLLPSDAVRYNSETNEICMKLGEKLLLSDSYFLLGGNACNVAVGLRRAGLTSAIIAEIGDDEFAELITNTLKKEQVNIDHLSRNGQSSFSIGISMHNDRVLLTEHRVRPHAFVYDTIETNWMYLTALGMEWKPAYETALTYISAKNIKLALNPGTLQLQEDISFFTPYFAKTDILFLNKQEAQRLVKSIEDSIAVLLEKFKALGCQVVVITDADNGAYAIDTEGKKFHVPRLDVPVVEKTGAGDSFASGFIAGYIAGLPVAHALNWGTVNAASVIGKIGAQDGLLDKKQLEEKVAALIDATQI